MTKFYEVSRNEGDGRAIVAIVYGELADLDENRAALNISYALFTDPGQAVEFFRTQAETLEKPEADELDEFYDKTGCCHTAPGQLIYGPAVEV